MSRLRRLLLALMLGLALGAGADTLPRPSPRIDDALRLIELWLDAQRLADRLPSLSVGVALGPDRTWTRGFGSVDAAGRVPVGEDTVYSVCSISKLFTAVAVMQLWEAGRLSLDDDVVKHVSEFALRRNTPDSVPITVRSLLMHAGGLPREAVGAYWTDLDFPTRAQLYERLRQQQTLVAAHERHLYSNLGMAVLGDVVAAASGMPYDEYVRRQLIGPLGLVDTQPRLPTEWLGQRLPAGHGSLRRDGTRAVVPPFDVAGLAAAAGFTTSARDLARFSAWQLGLLQRGGSDVLRASTLREMQRLHWQDSDGRNSWGLGFSVWREGGHLLVGHTGLCPGYRSSWLLAPQEGYALFGLTNADGYVGTAPYTSAMRQLLVKGWKLTPPADPAALQPYTGRFLTMPSDHESVVVPWGEGLAWLQLPANNPASALVVLRPDGPDRFRIVTDDGRPGGILRFERNAQGEVVALRDGAQRIHRAGPLPPTR